MGAELLALCERLHKTVALMYAMQIRERDQRLASLAELEAIMAQLDRLSDVARRLP